MFKVKKINKFIIKRVVYYTELTSVVVLVHVNNKQHSRVLQYRIDPVMVGIHQSQLIN